VVTDALSAIADPTRRRIFELVAERPSPVGELADQLPVSRPAVSQHLRVLGEAGLVRRERDGTRNIYRLDRAGLELLREYLDALWERSLDSFRAAVESAPPPASTDGTAPDHRPAEHQEER
jgi:DNA-binding transcriptional ArsR family regulator